MVMLLHPLKAELPIVVRFGQTTSVKLAQPLKADDGMFVRLGIGSIDCILADEKAELFRVDRFGIEIWDA